MEDPKTGPDAAVEAPSKVDVAAAAEGIRAFLETLMPPDEVVICDVFGKSYSLPTVASFRAQLRLGRGMQKLQTMIADGADVRRGRATDAIVAMLTTALTSEEFAAELCDMFTAAHPKALADARANVGDPNAHVLDLFPGEEVVAALVPLFARPAGRVGRLIGSMSKPLTKS